MLRKVVLCATVMALGLGTAVAQAKPLEGLPDEVIAVLEIGDLPALGEKLAAAALQISPMAGVPPLDQMAPMKIMKTLDPTTVDLTAPVRVVLLEPPMHTSPVIVFSVTDAERYLGSLLPNLVKMDERDGLVIFDEAGKTLAIGTANGRAALGQDIDAVTQVLELVSEDLLPAAKLFETGDVVAAVRVVRLLDGLSMSGQNPFDMARAMWLPMIAMGQQGGGDPEAVTKVLGVELDAVEAMVTQMDVLSLGLTFGEDAVTMTARVDPVEGGGLEQYVASIPSGDMVLSSMLPGDSLFTVVAKTGDMGPFYEWAGQIMSAMLPEGDAASEDMLRAMELTGEVLGDEQAMAMRAQGTAVQFIQVQAVDDPVAMEEAADAIMANMGNMMQGFQVPGMDAEGFVGIERNVAEHAGHRIDAQVFNIPMPDPAGMPNQQAAQMAVKSQQAMLDIMLGPDRRGYLTYIDGNRVYVQGEGALDTLKGMIDAAGSTSEVPAGLAAALDGAPAGTIAAGHVSLTGLANWGVGLARQMIAAMGQPMPAPLQALVIEDAPPIVVTVSVGEGNSITKRVRVPLAAMRSVANAAMMAQMAAVQAAAVQAQMP